MLCTTILYNSPFVDFIKSKVHVLLCKARRQKVERIKEKRFFTLASLGFYFAILDAIAISTLHMYTYML